MGLYLFKCPLSKVLRCRNEWENHGSMLSLHHLERLQGYLVTLEHEEGVINYIVDMCI